MKKGEDFQRQLNLWEDKFKGAWKGDGNANGGSNKNSSGITGLLKEKGVEDILVVAGGCILKEDVASLHEAGVDGIFLRGHQRTT